MSELDRVHSQVPHRAARAAASAEDHADLFRGSLSRSRPETGVRLLCHCASFASAICCIVLPVSAELFSFLAGRGFMGEPVLMRNHFLLLAVRSLLRCHSPFSFLPSR